MALGENRNKKMNYVLKVASLFLMPFFLGCGDLQESLAEESVEGKNATEIQPEGFSSEEERLDSTTKGIEGSTEEKSYKTGPFTVVDDIEPIVVNSLTEEQILAEAKEAENLLSSFRNLFQGFRSSTSSLSLTAGYNKIQYVDPIFFEPLNNLEDESCSMASGSLGRLLQESFSRDLSGLKALLGPEREDGSQTVKVVDNPSYPRTIEVESASTGQKIKTTVSGQGSAAVTEYLSTLEGTLALGSTYKYETSEVKATYFEEGAGFFDSKRVLFTSHRSQRIDYIAYGEKSEVSRVAKWSLEGGTSPVFIFNFTSKGIIKIEGEQYDQERELKLRVSFPDEDSMNWDVEMVREGQMNQVKKEFRGKEKCILTTK